ncbi:MAG: GNAT family N-acetyltransferase [Geminicoccaceae bacterium]
MLRPARAEDVATIGRIVRDAYGHYVARLGKPPGPMLDDYARRVADGQVWVLEDEGALAGILVLEDAEDGALLLDNLAIAPGAQGKGHGRTLVAFAEAEARRRGHSQVRLYTHVLMVENVAIYGRLGFLETHRVTEKGYDRVYMTKRLA